MNKKMKLKGQLRRFTWWPLILSILLLGVNVLIYSVNIRAGICMSLGLIVYVIIAVALFLTYKPMILNELIAFAKQYGTVQKRLLEDLSLPYAIMDMHGRMIWCNKAF